MGLWHWGVCCDVHAVLDTGVLHAVCIDHLLCD